MTQIPGDEELEKLLRNEPYVDDDGFTAKVVGALPPRRTTSGARSMILLGASLAALVVVALGPLRTLWMRAPEALATGGFPWPLVVFALLTLAVVCTTALSAFLREVEG